MQSFQIPTQAVDWLRQRVTGTLSSDSRALAPGDGFIAWPGTVADARQYVGDALQHGATASLVERDGLSAFTVDEDSTASFVGLKGHTGVIASEFFGNPSADLSVVAVTGTNGKTSTVWWLAQALSVLPEAQALPCGMVGTLGVGRPPMGVAESGAQEVTHVISTGMTTPDPVLLARREGQKVQVLRIAVHRHGSDLHGQDDERRGLVSDQSGPAVSGQLRSSSQKDSQTLVSNPSAHVPRPLQRAASLEAEHAR